MFFIAVFGVEDKEKHIGTYNNAICPSCGCLIRYEVQKVYRQLQVFFIPTVKWNARYFVRTPCCGSLYELAPDVGKEFERNPGIEIRKEDLRQVYSRPHSKYCSNCRIEVPEQYIYCPYCGGRI
jgi:hypothetical protein